MSSNSLDTNLQVAQRVHAIEPFRVMEMVKAAALLRRAGHDIISMSVGEPDFTAPDIVADAAVAAIRGGVTQYTESLGLPELRAAIAGHYAATQGLDIDPRRIVITAGASAGLLLACAALVGQGDEVLMPDPSYPCNRHFVTSFGGTPVLVPASFEDRYQLGAHHVHERWTARTRGVLVASPSNPTGTSMTPAQLRDMLAAVRARGGFAIVDEIYQGLSYDHVPVSALALDPDVITVNSFSKYFNMTGWRLGWMVVPEALVPAVERVAQNLFICASTIAQHAALACFEPESIAEFERRRAEFKARRDYFIPELEKLGLRVPVMPDGAFYAWADCTEAARKLGVEGSWDFAYALMQRAHLAITPGRDFGTAETANYVRFSTANSLPQLQEAVRRLRALLG